MGSKGLNLDKANVRILSIGTIASESELKPLVDDEADWGLLQWAPKLVNLLFEANARQTLVAAETLLGENFHRISPISSKTIALDKFDEISLISKISNETDLTSTTDWLKKFWDT